jgi:hypothetical protein
MHFNGISFRDRVTHVSPTSVAKIYIADVAVSGNQLQFGDYSEHNDKQHNELLACN